MKNSLALAYSMKKKKMAKGGCVCSDGSCSSCMAGGGEVEQMRREGNMKGVHKTMSIKEPGVSVAGSMLPSRRASWEEDKTERAKAIHRDKLKEMQGMPKPELYAHGGDIVDKVMSKRKMMSEGGIASNEDEPEADSMPAEYDDLELDDHLESTNSGKNDGDMLGDDAEEKDRHDIVARIMHSLAKKDRNPRPA